MAAGDRSPDLNPIGNFQRQLRLMGVRLDEMQAVLSAVEARLDVLEDVRPRKGRRDPADRVLDA